MARLNVLVVNAGGTTLDLTVVDSADAVLRQRLIAPWDGTDCSAIVEMSRAIDIDAVGHRVVHGGTRTDSAPIDDDLVRDLQAAAEFAPVHQHRSLLAIAAARAELPDVSHVACFDTAFHRTLPDSAAVYAVPRRWRDRWPLRRVGFHGLSHADVAQTTLVLAAPHPARRIVSCHLGSGASLCAVRDGISIDTTMGMTPLDGIVMVTRSGSVDPGMLLWLLGNDRLSLDELFEGLYRGSGLAGVAGGSGDMREIVRRMAESDADAILAFEIYIHRLQQGIASMVASLGGIDVLAFTGGIGQHMPEVRQAAVAGLAYLGLTLDGERNRNARGDADVSAGQEGPRCVVVGNGEHRTIARETRRLVRVEGRNVDAIAQ